MVILDDVLDLLARPSTGYFDVLEISKGSQNTTNFLIVCQTVKRQLIGETKNQRRIKPFSLLRSSEWETCDKISLLRFC